MLLMLVSMARLAFMLLRGASNDWQFGGLKLENGSWVHSSVANVPQELLIGHTQPIKVDASSPIRGSRSGVLAQGGDNLNFFLASTRILPEWTQEKVTQELEILTKIENPNFHGLDTTDCVSCHAMGFTRHLITEKFGTSPFRQKTAFVSPMFNTTLAEVFSNSDTSALSRSNSFRMLGYFQTFLLMSAGKLWASGLSIVQDPELGQTKRKCLILAHAIGKALPSLLVTRVFLWQIL